MARDDADTRPAYALRPMTGEAQKAWARRAGVPLLPRGGLFALGVGRLDTQAVDGCAQAYLEGPRERASAARVELRLAPGHEAAAAPLLLGVARALGVVSVDRVEAVPPPEAYATLRRAGWRVSPIGVARLESVPQDPGHLHAHLLTREHAQRWVKAHHQHLGPTQGDLFNLGAFEADGPGQREVLRAVASVGRPSARVYGGGDTVEVRRVAVPEALRGARRPHPSGGDHAAGYASFLLGAARRIAVALGSTRVVSATLLGEPGRSYRAAGFFPTGLSDNRPGGQEWARGGRERRSAEQPGRKVRWESGPGAKRLGAEDERELLQLVAREAERGPQAPRPKGGDV